MLFAFLGSTVGAVALQWIDTETLSFIIPIIGFYDGMFGPGTGSFYALAGVSCRGYDLIKSTAYAKPLNFAANVAGLVVFLAAGHVVWTVYGVVNSRLNAASTIDYVIKNS